MCDRYNQLSPEETQAACERVVQEVRWFRHSVNVAAQSQNRGTQETCIYNDYHAKLEREVADIDTEIKRLNEDLEVSRNNKRHKIAYDEIAIEANKLPTRERLSADISAITTEIEQLKQEEVTHNAVLESLRVQYSAVVDEMKRLESMSKSALSMQDLGIYLGDMEEDRGGGEPGGHSFLGVSPTTPHPPGDSHGDFGTPIDDSVLDDDGNDHDASEDSPNNHAKKNDEEAEAEDGDYTNDDIEDGEDSGHHHTTHTVDALDAESNAGAIDSEEEGECEDEEGELIV
ncbi:hypothetical protein LPJ72_005314 [Coemansia sp. Benny D160-2]|nr:hypothetical protein LPJ72_005314 [Coemansia sp. Benny D160-2]